MKKYVKKVICLVLALALAMSLCACSADPNCGKYTCKTVKVDDLTVNANEAFINGASIELKTAGACTVILDGAIYDGSWKSKDNQVTVTLEGTDSVGTISGNTLTIDLYAVGMTMDFAK